MIGGYQDFARWVAIFNLIASDNPPPPGFVSLQIAYDGGANFTILDGKPFNAVDNTGKISLNVDSGSQKIYSDYNAEIRGGCTTHLINQPITENLTIQQEQLDRVNINFTSSHYTYTLPLDDSFPDGSQFELLQFSAGGSITLVVPPNVFINGMQNTSIVLNSPFMRAGFRRIEQNQWTLFTVGIPENSIDGRYTPSITLIQGLTSADVVLDTDDTPLADYSSNSENSGVFITTRVTFVVVTNASSVQRRFRFTPPIASNFTTVGQARICGLPSIVKNPGTENNTSCGWNGNLTSDPATGDIYFAFETSELSTTYYIDLMFRYEKLA